MKPDGSLQKILAALRDYGPMTRVDIEQLLGLTKKQTSRLMKCITEETPRLPQRAHIMAYVMDQEGQKSYPRPMYCYGPGTNADKPKRDTRATQKRSRDKKKKMLALNSVFNMAAAIPYAARHLNRIRHEQQTERSRTQASGNSEGNAVRGL